MLLIHFILAQAIISIGNNSSQYCQLVQKHHTVDINFICGTPLGNSLATVHYAVHLPNNLVACWHGADWEFTGWY